MLLNFYVATAAQVVRVYREQGLNIRSAQRRELLYFKIFLRVYYQVLVYGLDYFAGIFCHIKPSLGVTDKFRICKLLELALVKKSASFGVTSTGCSISPITAGASITASGCSMPPGSTMSPGAPSIIRAQAKTRIKNKKLTDSTSLYPKYSTIPACLRHPHRGVMPALPKNVYCYHGVKGISHRRAGFRENSRRRHILYRQD